MDVRTTRVRWVRSVSDALARFNTRHPWSHNDHFHGWILRHLPPHRETALDVGCGQGLLLRRLSPHFSHVTGTDVDPSMRTQAAAGAPSNVTVSDTSLTQFPDESLDLITMVAVLHHLDLDEALTQVRRVLAPGARFLVVGLARPDSVVDLLVDLASAVANPIMGLVLHPRAVTSPAPDDPFPVRTPQLSFAQIGRVARRELPGVRLRRRLFFRYTLAWTKPAAPSPGAAQSP